MTAPDLAALDHAHVWHPFTPMRQWREKTPLIIERGQGPYLFDVNGNRYIDGTSSLWCNVHGHRHPHLDAAVRNQLDRVAHTTMLGLSNPPAIELASRLCQFVNHHLFPNPHSSTPNPRSLEQVFFTDAGATAVEVALKMAVGYWHHKGKPNKRRILRLGGAYHGDTVGSMSVGYSDLFHRPYQSLLFEVHSLPEINYPPEAHAVPAWAGCSTCQGDTTRCHHQWPNECPRLQQQVITQLATALNDVDPDVTAALIVEPVMQGAAGMMCQPPGFLRMLREWCDENDVLLIADEVATGFGRTGQMFACTDIHADAEPPSGDEASGVASSTTAKNENDLTPSPQPPAPLLRGPDILCLAKGLTAGYLPLAATLTTSEIAEAFEGSDDPAAPDFHRHRTLYHGHTYTGNPLAAAVANASLDLWEMDDGRWMMEPDKAAPEPPSGGEGADGTLLDHVRQSATLITHKLDSLRGHPRIRDIRQRGLMVGIELDPTPTLSEAKRLVSAQQPPASGAAAAVCQRLLARGVILRPLGNVLVLMPIPATPHDVLETLLNAVVTELASI